MLLVLAEANIYLQR